MSLTRWLLAMIFVSAATAQVCAAPPPPDPQPAGRPEPISPNAPRSTLDKIREYGAVYLGHRESSFPFSYMVGDAVHGYTWDICLRVVDEIRLKLGNPNLRVVPVPVSSASRFMMLMTGVIDLECGTTGNTRIRQQSVAFSVTTFVSGIGAMTRRDSGITSLLDLGGKTIATTAGSTTWRVVSTALASRNVTARNVTGRDHNDAFSLFESGGADVFALDDSVLAVYLARPSNRERYRVLDARFGNEFYAIALRKDDPEFKMLVDDSVKRMMASGEADRLYQKWFLSPTPPDGVNLQVPKSDALKALFESPDDKGG